MTDTRSRRRSRLNRTEQHLYTSRGTEEPAYLPNEEQISGPVYQRNEEAETAYNPNGPEQGYLPNEPAQAYMPNEPESEPAGYTPNEPDYAVYYSREGAETAAETAFAPPPSMQQYAFDAWEEEEQTEASANNVYRPRKVTWADDDRDDAIAESELGYQVQEEMLSAPGHRRHTLRNLLIAVLVLALLGGAAWLLKDQIAVLLGTQVFAPEETQEAVEAVVTPEPVKAYDAAPEKQVADTARSVISQLGGSLEMETYLTTEHHVITRNRRPDGSYDFYLFTSEGRLLCYFEGLEAEDMIPQDFGGFYVRQSPWLVKADGSALIRTSNVEAAINERVFLHPMYHGWTVVQSEVDGHANYMNGEGKLMSSLWFSRTFPFTGEYTLAYVDTGSRADDRYLLYVLKDDGTMTRWLAAENMEDVVAAVSDMAYGSDGSLYHLPDTQTPIAVTPEIIAYPDCDAMVIKDPASGKYGLFVHGKQHYAYVYDAIRPLESQLEWVETTLEGQQASIIIRAVSGAEYPLPLSHSFVLEKNGQMEYVALSTQSSYPIRLDGEF